MVDKDKRYSDKVTVYIGRMHMTIKEIAGNYSRSDHKVSDITRLADLNDCPEDVIEEIIINELGKDVLPKTRQKKYSVAPVQHEDKPISKKKAKTKVSIAVMEAVQDRMEQVDGMLMNVTRDLFQLEQKKKALEDAYTELIEFMETHYTEKIEE